MKQLRLILVVALISAIGTMAYPQTASTKPVSKTETFKVFGNCEMCKSRIEKSVKTDGVTSAEWVVKTNLLTVTYDPGKISSDALGKKIASVGHDTEKFKAPDDVYSKLPGCCHYERK